MPLCPRPLLLSALVLASGAFSGLSADDSVLVSTRREVLHILAPGETQTINLNQLFAVYPIAPTAKVAFVRGQESEANPPITLSFKLRAKERAVETDTFLTYALAPNPQVSDDLNVGFSYDLSWAMDYYWNPQVVNGFRTYGYLDTGTIQITGGNSNTGLEFNIPSETSIYNGRPGQLGEAKAGNLGMIPLPLSSSAFRPGKAFRLHLEDNPFGRETMVFADLEGDAATLLKPLQGFTTYNLNPFFHEVEESFARVPMLGTNMYNLDNLIRVKSVRIEPTDPSRTGFTLTTKNDFNSAIANKDGFSISETTEAGEKLLKIARKEGDLGKPPPTGMIFVEVTATYGDQKRYALISAYAPNVAFWNKLEGRGTVNVNDRYRIDGTVTWNLTDTGLDDKGEGWVLEDTLGHLFWKGTLTNLWFFDQRRQDWMWTSLYDPTGYRITFPFLYSLNEKAWLYFADASGEAPEVRWFYNYREVEVNGKLVPVGWIKDTAAGN